MEKEDLFIKMVLDAWFTQVKYANNLFDKLSNEELMIEVAPRRNRALYLLGHLTAVHDRMLPLLGIGDPIFPQLYKSFVESPDKAVKELPGAEELRQYWKQVNEKLATAFSSFTPAKWFQRHTAVTAEDFSKEPHRNNLNLIINRTNHLANHIGQLLLLKSQEQ